MLIVSGSDWLVFICATEETQETENSRRIGKAEMSSAKRWCNSVAAGC